MVVVRRGCRSGLSRVACSERRCCCCDRRVAGSYDGRTPVKATHANRAPRERRSHGHARETLAGQFRLNIYPTQPPSLALHTITACLTPHCPRRASRPSFCAALALPSAPSRPHQRTYQRRSCLSRTDLWCGIRSNGAIAWELQVRQPFDII